MWRHLMANLIGNVKNQELQLQLNSRLLHGFGGSAAIIMIPIV